jgi:Zn-dependent peptidase ImmA (M78 family)/DNA-binding XRE family transcriptional regulator
MNGDRVRRAREIKGWTQAELADAVDVKQAAISRIEQSLLEPSEQLAAAIAKETGFPLSFFYEETKIDFPLGSLLFRQHQTLTSRERDQVLQTAWAAYILYDFMAHKMKLLPLRLPRIQNEDIQTAAVLTRNALGIEPNKPIRNLINRLEKAGVIVLAIPLEIHGHDAFSLWANNRRAVIVIDTGKPGDRQRHTVAHEIAHLVMHYILMGGSRDEIEDEAELFAGELLTPEESVREEIVTPVTLSSLAELKARWGVSIQSLIERAFDLKIISVDQRKYLYKQMTRHGWRHNEPIEIEPERPRALRKMAELLYGLKSGGINYQKLARDVSLPVSLVAHILYVHSPDGTKARTPGELAVFPSKTEEKNPYALKLVG